MCGSSHRLEIIEPMTVPKMVAESVTKETDMAERGESSPGDKVMISF
jgi:hypothetical protein